VEAEAVEFSRFHFHRKRATSGSSFRIPESQMVASDGWLPDRIFTRGKMSNPTKHQAAYI